MTKESIILLLVWKVSKIALDDIFPAVVLVSRPLTKHNVRKKARLIKRKK